MLRTDEMEQYKMYSVLLQLYFDKEAHPDVKKCLEEIKKRENVPGTISNP